MPDGSGMVGRTAESGREIVGTSSVADGFSVGSAKLGRPVIGGTVMLRSGNEREGKEGRLNVGRDGHRLVGKLRRLPE